jgi:hypothetical protein
MRERSQPSAVHRVAAAALTAVLLLPAIGRAEDEGEPLEEAPPLESHWYDGPVRVADVTIDVLIIRPLSAVTLAVGAVLFVPAVILTAPNGTESMADAYERFVNEPGEYLWARPLGEL